MDLFLISEATLMTTTYHPYYKNYLQRQILASLIATVAITGFCGNSLVIFAVILSRKLRNTTNIFVVNLALADLLTCVSLPWTSVALLSKDGWVLPSFLCKMAGFCLILCLGCSVNTLVCIAVNRAVLITKSRNIYTQCFTKRKIAAMICITWLFPFFIATIPLWSEVGELGYDPYFITCSWHSQDHGADLLAIVVAVSFYPLQLLTIVICYFHIFFYVRKHIKKISLSTELELPSLSGRCNNNEDEQPRRQSCNHATSSQVNQNKKRLWKCQLDVTKNLFYVVCVFLVCFTPYTICIILRTKSEVFMFTVVVLLSNSCANFFLYASKHPDFRKVFKCIFLCKFSSIPGKTFH